MTWKIEDLNDATVADLMTFASHSTPTLRRLHALKALAVRATTERSLLSDVLDMLVQQLGPEAMIGGLPTGYLGAKALFDDERARPSLMQRLATVAPLEREDLLRWLMPDSELPSPNATSLRCEREVIFEKLVTQDAIEAGVNRVLGSSVQDIAIELLPLTGSPACVALVTLESEHWDVLQRRDVQFSDALNTTVYWPPPEPLGSLGPDLRVAINADGSRRLVIARYTADGFDIEEFHDQASTRR